MKKLFSYCIVATLSAGLFFSSCKKDKAADNSDVTEFQVQSDDQARFTTETDAIDDDVNAALENNGGSYAQRPLNPTTPLPIHCDATVTVDTVSTPRKITITYNGLNCLGNRTRTGTVVISFSPNFRLSAPGASYTITAQNLKITRLSDNKSITINGEKTITNVSGGKLRDLATRTSPIIHDVTSNGITVTFDNGTQRSWQVLKRRTFTYDNGIVIAVSGRGPQGVAEWGINRFNNAFTSAVLEPLTVKQSCDFRLVSGKIQHKGPLVTTTTTFGLDASGNPVTSCPGGAFYYQVVWTGPNGNSYSHLGVY